ncbi:MAG: hypothetical protein LBN43_09885 [Oscillospiraceae bacterium]|jgi:ABC-2 type transport system permease protein|nr:hypothetical protein [Oscillospiraceae bacterium]
MNLASSYFKFSPALFRENLKRFWTIPAFGMLCYFFAGLYPLIVAEASSERYYVLQMTARFLNPGFIIFSVLFPIITSVALNRYLFAPGSVSVMHSLPFTRGSMFFTNMLSGLVMMWAPIVVTYLISLAFMPNAYLAATDPNIGFYSAIIAGAETRISVGQITGALGTSLLLTAMYFLLFNLAATVTGNTPMHIIGGAFLSAVAVGLTGLVGTLSETMLFGFAIDSDMFINLLLRLTPIVYYPARGADAAVSMVIQTIITCVGLYALGSLMYAKRSLERAGDSLVYKFVEVIFVSIVTLSGMILMSAIISAIDQSNFPFNWGLIAGGVLSYAAVKMMAQKSVRIFNKGSAIHFGVTIIAVLLFLFSFRFDFYGYEKRLPNENDIESVYFDPMTTLRNYYSEAEIEFKSPDNIKAIMNIHRVIAEYGPNARVNGEDVIDYSANSISVEYKLNSGTVSRSWVTYADASHYVGDLLTILNSREFKEQNSVIEWAKPGINSISVSSGSYRDLNLNPVEFSEFLLALDADMRDEVFTADSVTLFPGTGIGVNLSRTRPTGYVYSLGRPYYQSYRSEYIKPTYTRTINWLNAKGYYENLRYQANRITVELFDVNSAEALESYEITDFDTLQNILDYGIFGDEIPTTGDSATDLTPYCVVTFYGLDERGETVQLARRSLSPEGAEALLRLKIALAGS